MCYPRYYVRNTLKEAAGSTKQCAQMRLCNLQETLVELILYYVLV